MGSSGKTRTTRAKLDREGKVRQKRADKEARKAARKSGVADEPSEFVLGYDEFDEASPGVEEDSTEPGETPEDAESE